MAASSGWIQERACGAALRMGECGARLRVYASSAGCKLGWRMAESTNATDT